MQNLTEREKDVLNYIEMYTNKFGYSPTLREISKGLYLAGTYSVQRHIISLKQKGYLIYIPKKARTLIVIKKSS